MLTYSRKATTDRRYSRALECWEFVTTVVLTLKRDGVVIGQAETTITWKEGTTWGYRRRKWVGQKFRADWKVSLLDREWTIPGLRTRTDVLAEIKAVAA